MICPKCGQSIYDNDHEVMKEPCSDCLEEMNIEFHESEYDHKIIDGVCLQCQGDQ